MGRPHRIATPEELWEKFQDYLEYCREHKRFVNVAGFCLHVEMARSIYYDIKRDKADIFNSTLEKIDSCIESEVFESKISPPERIFYLKNKFGYADKQEVHNINTHIEVDADDDLIEKLKAKYQKEVEL